MDDKQVLEELKRLIKEGRRYSEKLKEESEDDDNPNEAYSSKLRTWELSASRLLRLRFGEDSDFYREFRMSMDLQYYQSKDYLIRHYYDVANYAEPPPIRAPFVTSDKYYKKDIELAVASL